MSVGPSLTSLGLSPRADLVYRALTDLGLGQATEIARALGLKSRYVHAALDELKSVGAAGPAVTHRRMTKQDNRIWIGQSPDTVVDIVRIRQAQVARSLQGLHSRLAQLDGSGVPVSEAELSGGHGVRTLVGVAQIRERFIEIASRERFERLGINPESAFTRETVKRVAPRSRRRVIGGLQVRVLGVPPSEDDESGDMDREMIAYGMQYRELPKVPTKLFISDRAIALIPFDSAMTSKGYWEISIPSIVDRLIAMFYERWDVAREPGRFWQPPTTFSLRERAILALLAAGHTDAGMSALLDLSQRTVSSTVSNLMDRYEAQTRFQLGLILGAESRKTHPVAALRNFQAER